MLALFGASGAAFLAACAPTSVLAPGSRSASPAGAVGPAAGTPAAGQVPACIVRPELTEGPYFVDEKLNRSDIRSDPGSGSVRPGALLALTMNVSRISGSACTPLVGATVDVWHCDALGVYSDVTDPSFSTKGQKFLRGFQTTDASGRVQFITIYPGWYQGRAVHIHFKIRTASTGRAAEFTSQLFFDDSLNDEVFAMAPYSQKGSGRLRNSADGIFRSGGDKLLLPVTKTADGYAGTFDIGLTI